MFLPCMRQTLPNGSDNASRFFNPFNLNHRQLDAMDLQDFLLEFLAFVVEDHRLKFFFVDLILLCDALPVNHKHLLT